jgi:uncharacterized phiE125 gp8 family phage protein
MIAIISAATAQPVSLAQFKRWAEIDFADRDAEAQLALDAAVQLAQDRTGRIAQPTTLQLRLDDWASEIRIPAFPVREIRSVKFVDPDGVEQLVDAANYSWERTDEGAVLLLDGSYRYPTLKTGRHGVVRVTFDAGYDQEGATGSGDDPELVLDPRLKTAVLALATYFFENRGAVATDGSQGLVLPMHCQAMLDQLRIYR